MTTIIKNQAKVYGPKRYSEDGTTYIITATVRHDDRCENGHNTFAITADIREIRKGGYLVEHSGGCCHDKITKHFPELAPIIKWHLTSTDGPLHYIANTIYHAGDKDHNGLREGESRQIINGKTKLPCWILEADEKLPEYVDAEIRPEGETKLSYKPLLRIGAGKKRELDYARSTAVWPEATDEELTTPGLENRLKERHDNLMFNFKLAVESLGLIF